MLAWTSLMLIWFLQSLGLGNSDMQPALVIFAVKAGEIALYATLGSCRVLKCTTCSCVAWYCRIWWQLVAQAAVVACITLCLAWHLYCVSASCRKQ